MPCGCVVVIHNFFYLFTVVVSWLHRFVVRDNLFVVALSVGHDVTASFINWLVTPASSLSTRSAASRLLVNICYRVATYGRSSSSHYQRSATTFVYVKRSTVA